MKTLSVLRLAMSLFILPWPASAALRAVVIGVNAYRFETQLKGAVNDADSVAAAIAPLAESVERLTDAQVRRDAVFAALSNALEASRRGDTIFIAYAGHGGRERVKVTPDTPTGYREFWVMADFDRRSAGGIAQRILSTEIRDWLVEAHSAGVRVILLADHCYSGKIYRTAGVDVGSIRSIPLLVDPAIPAGDEPVPGSELELAPPPPGLVSLAADTSDKPVAEFTITATGKIHGALSYLFAAALTSERAELDPQGAGRVTIAALQTFLGRSVNILTDGQQYAQLRTGEPEDSLLFVLPGAGQSASPTATLMPIPFFIDGLPVAEAKALIDGVPGALWAADPAHARLIAHRRADGFQVLDAFNMYFHFGLPQTGLPAIVRKIQVADALAERAIRGRLSIDVVRGDGVPATVYFSHESVVIRVRNLPGPHLTVFLLSPDGRVAVLYPLPQDAPIAWPADAVEVLRTKVAPVFGADNLVAIASANELTELIAQLRAIREATGAQAALDAVDAALRADPTAQVQVSTVYTADASRRCDRELIRNAEMLAVCAAVPP